MYNCKFCNRPFLRLCTCSYHENNHCLLNPLDKIQCDICGKNILAHFKNSHLKNHQKLSENTKEKISLGMKKAVIRNPMSYNKSNTKRTVYISNNIHLDNKWELIVALYFNKHNILWERPIKGISYNYKNKEHLYFPDFYLPLTNEYIEVKGFATDRDYAKWYNLPNLKVFFDKEIKIFLNDLGDIDFDKYVYKKCKNIKHENCIFLKKAKKIINEFNEIELLYQSLFVFGINYKNKNRWHMLYMHLLYRFSSPRTAAKWFRYTYNKYKDCDRIKEHLKYYSSPCTSSH